MVGVVRIYARCHQVYFYSDHQPPNYILMSSRAVTACWWNFYISIRINQCLYVYAHKDVYGIYVQKRIVIIDLYNKIYMLIKSFVFFLCSTHIFHFFFRNVCAVTTGEIESCQNIRPRRRRFLYMYIIDSNVEIWEFS